MQSVDIVAMYGGDTTHLPSTSAKVTLAFGPLAFAIQPATPTVALGGTITFTSTGGVGAVKWFTGTDTTCDMSTPPKCSDIKEATGVFTAGAVPGMAVVLALDADGAEALATVNVVCTPKTACPAGDDCGTVSDGCGGTIACGSCTAPQTCGGGGTSNHCGCTPATSCPTGDACGTASDGCGGMITCGTCGAGQTCSGNQCVSASASGSSSSASTSSGASTGTSSSGTGGAAPTTSSSSSGGGSAPGHKGGCGCRVAGDPPEVPGTSLAAFGVLAFAGVVRTRRRRPTSA
jgi:MYXO-CTERM domain-containing protein